jgi:hypothetical protein
MIRVAFAVLLAGLCASGASAQVTCEDLSTAAGPEGSVWIVCKFSDGTVAVQLCSHDGSSTRCSNWDTLG